jgi:hypothetical protein
MTLKLKLTRLQHLNDTIVIQQEGGRYFIASPDSIIIDKAGLLRLIEELCRVRYISPLDIREIIDTMLMEEEDAKD